MSQRKREREKKRERERERERKRERERERERKRDRKREKEKERIKERERNRRESEILKYKPVSIVSQVTFALGSQSVAGSVIRTLLIPVTRVWHLLQGVTLKNNIQQEAFTARRHIH